MATAALTRTLASGDHIDLTPSPDMAVLRITLGDDLMTTYVDASVDEVLNLATALLAAHALMTAATEEAGR